MELNISDVRYSFVFPNETLHSDLLVRAVVENVSATSHPIVVPLMVREGYFTGRKIPGLLRNLSYAYPEEGERALTPHPNVAEWIELMVAKELSYPSVQIYDVEELLTITIEDAGKYHGEGVVELFPERFFELKTKCKLAKMGKGDVTKEEKKAFKLLWGELKEKLMYKPIDSVFDEVAS